MDVFSGIVPFVRVAEAGGFRAAAARLGVSAAAVSKAVAKLEGELGAPLFERTSRHVALTAEGAAFLERCREALSQLQAGRDQVAGAHRGPQGTLRVTFPPVLGRPLLPTVARLAARFPRLAVELVATNRLVRVVEENVDVALRFGPLRDSALIARKLRRPTWTTVAAPAYLAKRGAPIEPEELSRHACIQVALQGKAVKWAFRTKAGAVIVPTPSRFRVDHGELALDAALQGVGVAQVFDFMAAPLIEAGALVEVLAPFAAAGPPFHALMPARRASVSRVRVFVDAIEEVFGRGRALALAQSP